MPVVGTYFSKIQADKKGSPSGKEVHIKNNLALKDVTPMDLAVSQQSGVRFEFEYTTDYEPGVASMIFEGNVAYIDTDAAIKSILDTWKKKEPIDDNIMQRVMNAALKKSTIQSIVLSQDLGLAPPVQLPKVTVTTEN